MKKIILIAGLGLLTTAGVTAAVLSNKKSSKETNKKECTYKKDATSKKDCKVKKSSCWF